MTTYNKKPWVLSLLLLSMLIALLLWLSMTPSPQPTAGYVVIIEGSYFKPGSPHELSNKKSAEHLYQTLLSRGFTKQQIIYLGQDDTRPGVDAFASIANLDDLLLKKAGGDGINSLLEQLSDKPAPLHFFLIGHAGSGGNFYLNATDEQAGSEVLKATKLDAWLNTLEQIPQVTDWPRTVVIATPHSGGFIPALSRNKSGRVIVTSTTAAGLAFMAPEEGDGIPAASFFLGELLAGWGKGKNLDESFNLAAKRTRELTRADDSSFTLAGQYVENALQQPLLDDNADGVGTWRNTRASDGELAATIFLGTGQAEADDDFVVPATQFLDAPGISRLSVKATGANQKHWVAAVRVPGTKLLSTPNPIQIKLPYRRVELLTTPAHSHMANYDFSQSGRYEVWYWGEGENGKDTVSKRSVVLVKCVSNNASPQPFSLELPGKQLMSKRSVTLDPSVFEWSQAIDPDGDAVWYQAAISKSPKLDENGRLASIFRKSEELEFSIWVTGKSLKLKQEQQYYLQVLSYDSCGETTASNVQGFQVFALVVGGGSISGLINGPTGGLQGAAIRWNGSTISDAGSQVLVSKEGGYYYIDPRWLSAPENSSLCGSNNNFTRFQGDLDSRLASYQVMNPAIGLNYCSENVVNLDFVMDLDSDSDGIPDSTDNCTQLANPNQYDGDGDGYGNACDMDFSQDGVVSGIDVQYFKARYSAGHPSADINESGTVTGIDVQYFKARYGQGILGPSCCGISLP